MKKVLSLALSGILSLGLFCPTCHALRSKFTEAEDAQLRQLVQNKNPDETWDIIASRMPGEKTGRQCRDRYLYYLSPYIINTPWTDEENQLLSEKYQELGPRWRSIARFFPGRTDNQIKNRYRLLERKQRKAQRAALPDDPFDDWLGGFGF
ncbi:MAG: hypothetical protein LBR79_03065 [Oscillospiraceae bacterium]|jgi:hypothetical protein|nr:hypothetical protein [Oscillospiraceae bacterium]